MHCRSEHVIEHNIAVIKLTSDPLYRKQKFDPVGVLNMFEAVSLKLQASLFSIET